MRRSIFLINTTLCTINQFFTRHDMKNISHILGQNIHYPSRDEIQLNIIQKRNTHTNTPFFVFLI